MKPRDVYIKIIEKEINFTEVRGKGWLAVYEPLHGVASGDTKEEAAMNLAMALRALHDTLDPDSDFALLALSQARILEVVYGTGEEGQ